MRSTTLVVACCLLASCLESNVVPCDDGRTCPHDRVCDDFHELCVLEDQVTQCNDLPDRTECNAPGGPGTCQHGVCLEASCGNNRLDLVADETCDDGNNTDGDGCSADCLSVEVCGNRTVDIIKSEQCDDANALQHDGCDSTCKSEVAQWELVSAPAGRMGMAGALDASRGTVVMFGGYTGVSTGSVAETWEWDGSWRRVTTSVSPPPTVDAVMAYDHVLGRVILVGGSVNGVATAQVWTWNGAAWRQLASGPVRTLHSGAYDAKRKRVVVFGGFAPDPTAGVKPTNETWEFDGSKPDGQQWSKSPAQGPSARLAPAMAYDPKRGVVVLFGGMENNPINKRLDDVWEYDGTTWTQRTPSNGPPALWRASLAWDPAQQKLVLFGGFDSNGAVDGMWTWDGSQWASVPATPPAARGAALFSEDGRGRLLVYGGNAAENGGTPLGDTQLFVTNAWQPGPATPAGRYAHAGAYDPTRHRFVMFGGFDGGTSPTRQTWARTETGWNLVDDGTGTAPPSIYGERMVYDVARDTMMLFGGTPNGSTFATLVWLFSNGTWQSVTPATTAPGRTSLALAYDEARKEVVMFGGAGPGYLDDTWTWNGSNWTQKLPAHKPPARVGAAIGYDPIRQVIVLFGGQDASTRPIADTWIWDGSDWTEVATPVKPSPRSGGTLTWNAARRALVLAGGVQEFLDAWEWVGNATSPASGTWQLVTTSSQVAPRERLASTPSFDGSGIEIVAGLPVVGGSPTNEQWRLRYAGPVARDTCRTGFDHDGDGKTGCDEPDCWADCTPLCPPGAPCDMTAPRCGDDVCSSIESCRSCPGDCDCAPTCGDFICDPGETCPGDCPV